MSKVLGSGTVHTYSQNDFKGRCPSCYGSNTTKVGVLTVDGSPRDTHKCDNCNRLFSGVDGGIASLVDEAKSTFQTENVGFTSVLTTDAASHVNSNNYGTSNQITLADGYKVDNMSNNIQYMKNEFQNMTYAIQDLVNTVRNLAQQNKDLMEKMAKDPLNGIRKAVNEFNLE